LFLPDPGSIPLVSQRAEILEDLSVRPAPGRGVLECPGVLLEDHPGVVTANLSGNDVGDVPAAAARTGDGIDKGERLLRERDVGADESHHVTPNVNVSHTS
jgi:hypothetical protein